MLKQGVNPATAGKERSWEFWLMAMVAIFFAACGGGTSGGGAGEGDDDDSGGKFETTDNLPDDCDMHEGPAILAIFYDNQGEKVYQHIQHTWSERYGYDNPLANFSDGYRYFNWNDDLVSLEISFKGDRAPLGKYSLSDEEGRWGAKIFVKDGQRLSFDWEIDEYNNDTNIERDVWRKYDYEWSKLLSQSYVIVNDNSFSPSEKGEVYLNISYHLVFNGYDYVDGCVAYAVIIGGNDNYSEVCGVDLSAITECWDAYCDANADDENCVKEWDDNDDEECTEEETAAAQCQADNFECDPAIGGPTADSHAAISKCFGGGAEGEGEEGEGEGDDDDLTDDDDFVGDDDEDVVDDDDSGDDDDNDVDAGDGDDDVCTPDCSQKECGDDGCGGFCGECYIPPSDFCLDAKTLREYEFWGVCDERGKCQYEYIDTVCEYGCEKGTCLPCAPNCFQKECGPDGCGGSCGECPNGENCDTNGAGVCIQCVGDFDCSPEEFCKERVCIPQNPICADYDSCVNNCPYINNDENTLTDEQKFERDQCVSNCQAGISGNCLSCIHEWQNCAQQNGCIAPDYSVDRDCLISNCFKEYFTCHASI